MGPISYYLGIKVTRDRKNRTLSLSQEGYIRKILELLKTDDGRPSATPGVPGKYYELNPRTASEEESHRYLHIIGSAMYRANLRCSL
jgi:hypothetical protein